MYSKLFVSKRAAVATEHPLAALAAFEVLRSDGDAVDAAVAAGFSLAVTQHHLGGLGGDFFALIYRRDEGKVYCINASGRAPSGLTVEAVKSHGFDQMPTYGPYTVTIPGLVKGLQAIHQKFGKIDFSKLLSYPIELAEEGFPAYPGVRRSTEASYASLPKEALRELLPDGHLPEPGDTIRQKKLAKVLKDLAQHGPEEFYNGWIAEKICEEVSRNGPLTTIEDFRQFDAEWVKPLSTPYRGVTVYEVPPNSMGATTLLILKHIEAIDLNRLKPDSAERIDVTLKAVRAAYDKRDRYLADPRYVKIDMKAFLTPEEIGKEVLEGPRVQPAEGDTTYFAVADEQGNMVSCIQSLFHHFGARVYVKDCGIFLNNRGAGFQLEGPNKVEPHKRPLHTLSALMIGPNDKAKIALGCSGGNFRPQQHALLVTNIVDYSMSLEKAIEFPRFLWTGGIRVNIEQGFDNLRSPDYEIQTLGYPGRTGVAQGVEILPNGKKAVCDVRGDGIPLGF